MSLGFIHPQGEISEAITEAYGKEIPVSASASKSGANTIDPITHPARMSIVFCISATDALGNRLTMTPPAQTGKENFIVIGASINSAWVSGQMERKPHMNVSERLGSGMTANIPSGGRTEILSRLLE
jgi:hypothetical protein